MCSNFRQLQISCYFSKFEMILSYYRVAYYIECIFHVIKRDTMIEPLHIRLRQRNAKIKKTIQISRCIKIGSVMLSNRMLQLIYIYREYEGNSVIRKIMLNSFKQTHRITWLTAIQFINKHNKAIPVFGQQTFEELSYEFFNMLRLFYFF